MHRLLFLVLTVGCEQIEPSGNPLQPAPVSSVAPTAVPVHVVESAAVIEDEDDDTFSLSSEEMAPGAPSEPAEASTQRSLPSGDAPPPAVEPGAAAPPAPPSAVASSSMGWSQQVGKAWPVRLVTTVPNASPPRAILGLSLIHI